jgi:hypothetical protein
VTAIREQIFAAIDARLEPLVTDGEYARMPSGDPSKFPALHLFDQDDAVDEGEAGTTHRVLSLGIDGYVQEPGGAAAHAAANALYAAAIEALFTEPVLGGLAHEITEQRVQFTVAERASKRRVAFSLDLTIHYATRRGSPQVIE